MKNKNGFISMTVVYGFLIIFLFLVGTILATYKDRNTFMSYLDTKVNEDLLPIKSKAITIYNRMLEDNIVTSGETVDGDSAFDYNNIATDDNGKGLYYLDSQNKVDENNDGVISRIYFYRGNVSNNYVLLKNTLNGKNYCFRIIRTNENSSIRLIFIRETTNTTCSGAATSIATTAFNPALTKNKLNNDFYIPSTNTNKSDNAFVGYMYGKPESIIGRKFYEKINDDKIKDGLGNLTAITHYQPTRSGNVAQIRFNDTHNYYDDDLDRTDASNYKYFRHLNSVTLNGNIELRANEVIETIGSVDRKGNESKVKAVVDNWYVTNFGTVTNGVITDAIYCNDRDVGTLVASSTAGFALNNTNYKGSSNLHSFVCTLEQDRFSLSYNRGGERLAYNSLIYPVGLPTYDDVVFAGGAKAKPNSRYYLNLGAAYWTMTPYNFASNVAYETVVNANGEINKLNVQSNAGVFPVLSIRGDSIVLSGVGTVLEPYIIELK